MENDLNLHRIVKSYLYKSKTYNKFHFLTNLVYEFSNKHALKNSIILINLIDCANLFSLDFYFSIVRTELHVNKFVFIFLNLFMKHFLKHFSFTIIYVTQIYKHIFIETHQ